MSLDFTKVTYIDGSTVIGADNLNDIQDAILALDSNKVESESGKGLSTEDYTSAEKSKLSGIQAGAQVNPGNATTSVSGLMSSVDKIKLDGISTGATAVTIDSTLTVEGQASDAKATGDALAEKYEKPSGGIPDSDIASASTWNAKGTYSKPSGGIPKSDLASAVQTSLDKADSALQSVPSTYRTATAQDVIDAAQNTEIGKKYEKPSGGIPKTDLTDEVKTSLGKADSALQSVPDTYRTAAAQDVIDESKQTKITASGMLKGDGNGSVTAATAGTDYQAPLIAGTDYETPAGAKALGLTGASAGDLVRVNAVDANGKPTSWNHVPLCEIKTNPNLLNNWYFVGGGSQQGDGYFPINQRGQSYYPNAGYCIDRWMVNNGSLTLQNTGLRFSQAACYLSQSLSDGVKDALDGKTLTFSCFDSYNHLVTGSTVYRKQPAENIYFAVGDHYQLLINTNGDVFIWCADPTVWLSAVKLELGSEQSLAHQNNGVWVLNGMPKYEEELAKCQHYYLPDCSRLCSAYYYGDTYSILDISIPTPVKMSSQLTAELVVGDFVIRSSDNTLLPIEESKPVSIVAINANAVIVRVSNLTFGNSFSGLTANTVINLKSTI